MMPGVLPRITVIVNPAAGRGGVRSVDRLLPRLDTPRLLVTTAPGDAERFAREVASEGGIVVAAGGDGTVGEVAAGLSGSTAALAVYPVGTGNDFARTIGIGTSLEAAAKTICEGRRRTIDMIRWRCGDREGLGVNVAGCGFDALVAERINKGFRVLRGTPAYIAAVAVTLGSYRPATMRLTVDGETTETTVMLCAVANACSYGGGMRVAPTAELDDALLDVVVVEGVSKVDFIRAFPSVFSGAHLSHPRVRHLRGLAVSIVADPPLPVLSDGELVGCTPATFEVLPGVLHVMVPSMAPSSGS
jgi:diacylglycerol kinase (ATP)